MDANVDRIATLDRIVQIGFLLATIATVAALAAATVDFDVARPIAFVAGALLILSVLLSAMRQQPCGSFDADARTQINPATGLPMLGNARIDIRGNAYGRNDH